MRRRIATLAAMSVLALAFGATPALAGNPAQHVSIDATQNDPIVCAGATYTIVSGTLDVTYRFGSSTSGNTSDRQTWTTQDIVVEDQAHTPYRAVGTIHVGATSNATTGGSEQIYMWKVQMLGTADSLNIVLRFGPTGEFTAFGPGTCAP